jgi:hypothetical protein
MIMTMMKTIRNAWRNFKNSHAYYKIFVCRIDEERAEQYKTEAILKCRMMTGL